MNNHSKQHQGCGSAAAVPPKDCKPAPKWTALISDRLFPMPHRRLTARDVLDQAGINGDFVLIRDHETQNDLPFENDAVVDLGEGNVFRANSHCVGEGVVPACIGAAKLAFVLDDLWKVTLTGIQTERSLKRLFGLSDEAQLFRDYESPNDRPIGDSETVEFKDGPVFTAKRVEAFCINIEGTKHPWPMATITTAEIRSLGNLPADQEVVYEDEEGRERTLREDEVVTLDPCCRFGRAPKYKRG